MEEVHLLFENKKIILSGFVNLHDDSNIRITVEEIVMLLRRVLVNNVFLILKKLEHIFDFITISPVS